MTGEEQYLSLLKDVLENGESVEDRTGTGCISKIDASMRFDLSEGFPLFTTKKIYWKNIFGECLWMLNGFTDLPSLRKFQCKEEGAHTIWSDDFKKFWESPYSNKWYKENQEGGKIYGAQLRRWEEKSDYDGLDQLQLLVDNILAVKEDPSHPMGRRLKCEFWNPIDHLTGDKQWTALPSCHTGFQCFVRNGKLSLKFTMRSSDLFLGTPYNVAFYALVTHILAKITGLEVGELIYNGSDVHIYSNHVEQVREQLSREPFSLPTLVMPEITCLNDLYSLTAEDFDIEGYIAHGFISAPQAS